MKRIDVNDAGSPPRGPAATTVRKQNQQNKKKSWTRFRKKKKIQNRHFLKNIFCKKKTSFLKNWFAKNRPNWKKKHQF